ncbi:MAG: phosphoribosylglycinamide formyltransferase [Bacteroidota bacterium]|nr:phosphoribosylglycinamide formyltransferase [Bacteroidota bacterium]
MPLGLKIAVFASGRGSNFQSLYNALREDAEKARIVVVISNNSDAGALAVARSLHLPAIHLSQKQYSSHAEFVEAVLQTLESFQVNLIVLAGYMKKIDAAIIGKYRNRIINIHPALLPAFGGQGMYGIHVHEAVIASGARASGATVHIVDEEFDHGKIILQETVPVEPNDTPEILAERVLKAEHKLLPRVVRLFAENKIEIINGEVHIRKPD